MPNRVIESYYDIDRGRWCSETGYPVLERMYPFLNTFETPLFVLSLLDKDGEQVFIPADSEFTFGIMDGDDNLIATPIAGYVNNPDDYDADSRYGILSFRMQLATAEAVAAVGTYKTVFAYANLDISNTMTGFNLNLSAPVHLNKVVKPSGTIIPCGANSQYRINVTDGGTDIFDQVLNRWFRPVLLNGVMTYYEAP